MNTWFSDCYSTGKFVLGGTSSLPAAVKLRIGEDPIIQTRYDIQTGGGGPRGVLQDWGLWVVRREQDSLGYILRVHLFVVGGSFIVRGSSGVFSGGGVWGERE